MPIPSDIQSDCAHCRAHSSSSTGVDLKPVSLPQLVWDKGNGNLPAHGSDSGLRLPVASAANTAHAASISRGLR